MRKLSIVLLLVLAACAHRGIARSWEGAPARDLVNAWGPPDHQQVNRDGFRQLVYAQPLELAGVQQGCEATFTLDRSGTTIRRVAVKGLSAGCSLLLNEKPARGQ